MQHYSFTVWKDPSTGHLAQTYYFDLDEDGNLIKLGDGSFGIVFRVRDQPDSKVKGNYAVKIFYKGEDIVERFHLELTFMDIIREVAMKKNIHRSELIDVLEPKGGSPKFHESDAYKNLFCKKFSDLNISAYVIVMERYDGTLKDLLENKSPKTNLTGYEVLRSMPVNDRIKWTLPFVQACINGLRTLYVADNAHLDLKPANIFYKEEGNEFKVVIGDMGYLSPQNDRTIESKTTHAQDDFRRRPLLGTLHYRSPEQKDNYEICDAAVKKISDHTFELTIQDPKFNDSIIEKDDFVYFSKSQEKHPYMIAHIERSSDEKQKHKYTRIVLNDADSEVGIREDDKTQIVIRKRQRLRTDLFAIGAVAYDLLTCGQSPERFYERLRIWDNHNTSIEEIMSSYGRVASFNSSEPQAQHIFESLNFGTKYAHDKIVRFILGCMLYNSPGSFYNLAYRQLKEEEGDDINLKEKDKRGDGDSKHPLTIDEKILCNLRSRFLDEFSDYLRENCRMGNPIVFREKPTGAVNTDENLRLSSILDSIQGSTTDHFVERYMLGVHYVNQLLDYVSEIFDLRSPFYFAELNPENIVESNINHMNGQRLSTQYVAFPTKKDYLKDLKEYKLHIKLKTNAHSFFIPNYLVYIHRPVKLSKPAGYNTADFTEQSFQFGFNSRTYPYDKIKVGDWILARKKDNKNELYRIKGVNMDSSTLELCYFDIDSENTLDNRLLSLDSPDLEEKDPFVYFKDIDREAYYLQMLAIYIHQFFFAGLNSDSTNSLPAKVEMTNTQSFIYIKDKYWCRSAEEFLENFKQEEASHEGQEVFQLMGKLTNLYIRLIFHQLDNSFYRNNRNAMRSFPFILSDVKVAFRKIRQDLEKLLRVQDGYLDRVRLLEPMLRQSLMGINLDGGPDVRVDLEVIRSGNERIAPRFPNEFKFESALEMMLGYQPYSPQSPPPNSPVLESPESAKKKSIWGFIVGQ